MRLDRHGKVQYASFASGSAVYHGDFGARLQILFDRNFLESLIRLHALILEHRIRESILYKGETRCAAELFQLSIALRCGEQLSLIYAAAGIVIGRRRIVGILKAGAVGSGSVARGKFPMKRSGREAYNSAFQKYAAFECLRSSGQRNVNIVAGASRRENTFAAIIRITDDVDAEAVGELVVATVIHMTSHEHVARSLSDTQ